VDAHLSFRLPGKRVHLGVCGSIAAYRAPDILRNLRRAGVACSVTLTPSAARFITPLTFQSLEAAPVYTSMFDDREAPSPFAHLEPGQTAQAMLIAPASATTIARLAAGLGDGLLACQALAFDGPLVLAPAMNPKMWAHAATRAGIDTLRARGAAIVEPGWGNTACGERGQGRLAELEDIHAAVLRALTPQDMRGKRVLITLGPTRESWDGLRYWSNPSTGVMGASLAVAAWLRGAEVHAVTGPGSPRLPGGIHRYDVCSADQMADQAASLWPDADAGIFAAAVADFKPEPPEEPGKFKKSSAPDGFSLRFIPNRDILAALSASRRPDQRIVGFCAESHKLEEAARGKLCTKSAHLIVGNLIADGFGTTRSATFVTDADGRSEHWDDRPKTEIAWDVLTWLLSL
jgi:phosphopantothenoylcysteine decarboxylase/phosphopantothenate--cysteine ligase